MNTNKKTRERHYLDAVRQIWPGFPQGEIIEGESPDFLIHQDSLIIGIEMVDYLRGQSKGESIERRNETLWQEIANTAKQEFEANKCEPLWVLFNWNGLYPLKKSEIQELAHEAKKLVESNIPTILNEKSQIGSDKLEDTKLDGICNYITIQKMRDSEQSLWSSVSAGFTGVQVDELQSLIDKKNAKIQKYLQRCDVVWLLMIADGLQISSSISLSELILNNTFLSPFEQVLIYDHINKHLFPLKLR